MGSSGLGWTHDIRGADGGQEKGAGFGSGPFPTYVGRKTNAPSNLYRMVNDDNMMPRTKRYIPGRNLENSEV